MFFDVEDLKINNIFLKLNKTCEEQLEKKWLLAYYFDICLLNSIIMGHCDLRSGNNEKIYIGGNIGYKIYEEYRRHHYVAKACELLFRQANIVLNI